MLWVNKTTDEFYSFNINLVTFLRLTGSLTIVDSGDARTLTNQAVIDSVEYLLATLWHFFLLLLMFPGHVILDIVFPLLILMKALIFRDVNNAFVNLQIIPVWNPRLLPCTWTHAVYFSICSMIFIFQISLQPWPYCWGGEGEGQMPIFFSQKFKSKKQSNKFT